MLFGTLCRWYRSSAPRPTVSATALVGSALLPESVRPVLPTTDASHQTNMNRLQVLCTTPLRPVEALHALNVMREQGMRHENAVRHCLDIIFKAEDVAPDDVAAGFLAIAALNFTGDPQHVSVAIGKSIQVSGQLSEKGLLSVYQALSLLNREHFSMTEVALARSNIGPDNHYTEFFEQSEIGLAQMTQQPNMLPVVYSALEDRLLHFCRSRAQSGQWEPDMEHWVPLLESVSAVGLHHANSINDIAHFIDALCGGHVDSSRRARPSTRFLLGLVLPLSRLRLCELSPLHENDYVRETFASAKRDMLTRLARCANFRRDCRLELRKDSQLTLNLRQAFEKDEELWKCAASLWDSVRVVKCSRSQLRGSSGPREQRGKLFQDKYKVKLVNLTPSYHSGTDGEARIPPQFKKWNTAVHKGPGGHHHKKNPRIVKFGVRRIPSDYIKKKREKYSSTH